LFHKKDFWDDVQILVTNITTHDNSPVSEVIIHGKDLAKSVASFLQLLFT